MSMLVNADSTNATRFGFELQNGDGFLFGRVNEGWGMFTGPNGKMGISNSAGGYQTWVGVPGAPDSSTHLLVVKVDYEANAIKLWVDPVPGAPETTPSATLVTGGAWTVNLNSQQWTGIRLFHENTNQVADELTVGTTWADVNPSGDDLWVEDGFDYPAGNTVGDGTQNGGVGFAEGSSWSAVAGGSGDFTTVTSGLSYTRLATSGAGALTTAGWAGATRPVEQPIGGRSFFMSMLLNANGTETTRLGFELQDSGDGPLFGRVNGGWGMFSGPNGALGIGNTAGGYQTWTGVTVPADSNTHLLVYQFDYNAQVVNLWLDPVVNVNVGATPPPPTATLSTGGAWTVAFTPATFWNTVRFYHEANNQLADELRVGATWDSVVPFFLPGYVAWAESYGLNPLTNGAPDAAPLQDGFTNLQEYQYGMNPTVRGGVPGHLLVDTWFNVLGSQVIELVHNPRFTGPPDSSVFVTSAQAPTNQGSDYGERMRGFVIAPVTGDYVFYVAADYSAELWLSSSESQFARQKIAWTTSPTGIQQWTQFPTQASAPVTLQAGQKYYIEALMKESTGNDHLEIGWTQPGGSTISIIPGSALQSYCYDADNESGDNMPDDWKAQHGLDPTRNDASEDPDHDGISNYLEYLAGTDPQVANTNCLTYERWNNLDYTADLVEFERDGITARPADFTSILSSAAAPSGVGSAYGARLSGYVTAPFTGDFTFYISGFNHFELDMSPDDSPFNKTRVAWGDEAVQPYQWDALTTQRSKTVRLVTGQRYYLEALLKQGDGNSDHLEIGWSYDSPIKLTPSAIGVGVSQSWSQDSNGVVSLNVVGGDIWDSSDNFSYYSRPWTGDGEVIAQVTSCNNPSDWAKLGVMIRATMDPGSAQAMMCSTPGNGVAFQRRTQPGGQSSNDNSFLAGAQWLRLVRSGQTISAYVSVDGIDWIGMGSDTFPNLPYQIYVGIAATNHGAGSTNPLIATVQGFTVRSTTATGLIPPGLLSPYTGNSLDANNNGLPDAWETQYPVTGSAFDQSQYGDPDGDLLTNLQEYQRGFDPTVSNNVPGLLRFERWNNLPGYTIGDLVGAHQFYGPPDSVSLQDMTQLTAFSGVYYGTRTRGYITPTVTGNYTFWVSGSTSVELWFSSDLNLGKYAKQRVAAIGSDLGDGHGIVPTDPNLWDQFSTQQSAPVQLQAGQSYYFEVLQKTDHEGVGSARVAWAHDGGDRELLPSSVLSSYNITPDDLDDDYLPDAWETQYGLDPTDNGYKDQVRQGERGDFDGCGLTNRQMFLLGIDPSNPNNGYGMSYGDLYRALGTTSLTPAQLAANYVSDVSLTNYTNSTVGWTQTSSGLIPDNFRGGATWSFSVPNDGFWLLRINSALMGTTYDNEQVPVIIQVDGQQVMHQAVSFGSDKTGMFQALTPWITAGTHQLTLFVDNMTARRTLSLLSIQVYAPVSPLAMLAQSDKLITTIGTSLTSPAFVEGYARNITSVTVNGNAVAVGTGGGHWYANVPLANVGDPQACAVQFEPGFGTSGNFVWQATNVMSGQSLTIRQGDSLRIGAWGSNLALTSVVTSSAGGTWNLTGNQTAPVTFNSPGNFVVSAVLQNGTAATMSVTVIGAPSFPGGLVDVAGNIARTITCNAAPQVAFDTQFDLCHLIVSNSGSGGVSINMLPNATQAYGVAARLGAGGPILGVQQINVIGVSDALQNDLTTQSASNVIGYKIYNAPLTVTNLPTGAHVDISIFRAGVMFLNGSTLKSIYPSDLTNGWINLQFLFPIGMPGGYCHSVLIYDRNGTYLGTR